MGRRVCNVWAGSAFLFLAALSVARAEEVVVKESTVVDEKAVFATVESANVIAARGRIGGTVADLRVKQGDRVDEGQVIAVIGDQKLGLQIRAQTAQVQAARAQMVAARRDLERGEQLAQEGFITKAKLDQLRAAYDVAANTVASLGAQESVVRQQKTEGNVLAPKAGRVLTVPVTAGSVVMPGDTIATLAEQNYILRLSVPERHAVSLKPGDWVRVDAETVGNDGSGADRAGYGTIKLVYPKVENGRVMADATVSGLGDYFVGQRVRVWIGAGERKTMVVPVPYRVTQSGIDYVFLKTGETHTEKIPVQCGRMHFSREGPAGVEVLSGLREGDVVVRP